MRSEYQAFRICSKSHIFMSILAVRIPQWVTVVAWRQKFRSYRLISASQADSHSSSLRPVQKNPPE